MSFVKECVFVCNYHNSLKKVNFLHMFNSHRFCFIEHHWMSTMNFTEKYKHYINATVDLTAGSAGKISFLTSP